LRLSVGACELHAPPRVINFGDRSLFYDPYASGASYEGEWAGSKKHGKGTYTSADGNSYEGEYAEGKEHGKGTYTYASGEVEVGCYEAGADVGHRASSGVRTGRRRGSCRPARRCAASRWTRRPGSPSGSVCRRPEAVHTAETNILSGSTSWFVPTTSTRLHRASSSARWPRATPLRERLRRPSR